MTVDRRTVALFDLHAAAHAYWHKSATKELTWTHDSLVGRIEILSRDYPLCAVCSDLGRSFRYEIDPSYKIGRMPQDEEAARERDNLQAEIRRAKQTLRDRGFVVLESDGYEGEDIIATATVWVLAQGHKEWCKLDDAGYCDCGQGKAAPRFSVEIVGADKDLMCLVSDNLGVSYRGIMSGERFGDAGVLKKYGVSPDQMVEWLALVGDAADSIHGVTGVGDKKAARLLEMYGTVATMFAVLDDLSTAAPAAGASKKEATMYEKQMSEALFTPSVRAALFATRSDGSLNLAVQLIALRADAPIDCSAILASEPPIAIVLNEEDSDWFAEMVNNPPEPTPALRALMAIESEEIDIHTGARRYDIDAKPVGHSDPVAPPARIQDPPVLERIRPVTDFAFAPALRDDIALKLALLGITGSGKTYTALKLMTMLLGGIGPDRLPSRDMVKQIAVIDSERGSARRYAQGRPFWFSTLELKSFEPEAYVEAVREAARAGFKGLIIDSLSHEWAGTAGALEQVDRAAKKGNTFVAWGSVTPRHNAVIDAIIGCQLHTVATMRQKMAHEQTVEDGKKVVKKLGMQAVQRDGIEYEFDIVGELDSENTITVTKTRCSDLAGKVYRSTQNKAFVDVLREWIVGGEKTAAPASAEPVAAE